jgi:hypothetical protein
MASPTIEAAVKANIYTMLGMHSGDFASLRLIVERKLSLPSVRHE